MKYLFIITVIVGAVACRMFSTDPLTPDEVAPFCHQFTRSGTWEDEEDCRRRELAALDAGRDA